MLSVPVLNWSPVEIEGNYLSLNNYKYGELFGIVNEFWAMTTVFRSTHLFN